MKKKEYTVSDLFYSSWLELTPKKQAMVYALQQHIRELDKSSIEYGAMLIKIMRTIRKRPLLVDKLNEEQLVDCYNDLSFLNEPWYYFPQFKLDLLASSPAEKMALHTFDHFIYADNEYSSFLATKDPVYLRRLLVTLYSYPGERYFEKEAVDKRAAAIDGKIKEWQMNLVFFTFTHIRNFVNTRCPMLLPKRKIRKTEDGEEAEPTPISNTGPMWNEIKHSAAKTLVFGSFEKTGRANMYDVLDHLEFLMKIK
jgi:hypothetical protein